MNRFFIVGAAFRLTSFQLAFESYGVMTEESVFPSISQLEQYVLDMERRATNVKIISISEVSENDYRAFFKDRMDEMYDRQIIYDDYSVYVSKVFPSLVN